MRLNLYWRGKDVIDIEVHANSITASVWTTRPVEEGPSVHRGSHLVDSSRAWHRSSIECFGFSNRR